MNTQQNRIDMAIEPKSDQINYDDFLDGPKTITITDVTGNNKQDAQPVNIHHNKGKPFRPCKSMRRVIVQLWGSDARQYVGKSMTLYGDPDVTFGGKKVGGIRISHMSHIKEETMVAITASRAKRVPTVIKPLVVNMIDDGFVEDVEQSAIIEANKGTDNLRDYYNTLPPEEKSIVRKKLAELKQIAAEADQKSQSSDFDDTGDQDTTKLDLLREIADTQTIAALDTWKEKNQDKIDQLEAMYPSDFKTVMDAYHEKEAHFTA